MVFHKMNAILFKAEHHWKTECRGKTKQKATIGIPNAFGIPAPTVLPVSTKIQNSKFYFYFYLFQETPSSDQNVPQAGGLELSRARHFALHAVHRAGNSFIHSFIHPVIHSFILLCQLLFEKHNSEEPNTGCSNTRII